MSCSCVIGCVSKRESRDVDCSVCFCVDALCQQHDMRLGSTCSTQLPAADRLLQVCAWYVQLNRKHHVCQSN
jgi:hypothetical protein